MAYALSVGLNDQDLLRIAAKFGLSAKDLNIAAMRAVNDVAKTGRGRTRKRVRAHVTLPARRVNDAVQVVKRAKPNDLNAIIGIDWKPSRKGADRPGLMNFKGTPKKPRRYKGRGRRSSPPFKYQILKTSGKMKHPSAFVGHGQDFAGGRPGARGRVGGRMMVEDPTERATGKPRAFIRDPTGRISSRTGRTRLIALKGPSVAALWQNRQTGIAADVMKDLNQQLAKRIHGQAQRLYDRKWKKVTR